MIPTVTKKKLPAFLAYPVDAQIITDALSAVPQIDELELWFTPDSYGEFEVDGKHVVLAACYQKYNMGLSASHTMDASGFYGPKWVVWVYSVPKPLNSSVRAALIDHGFKIVSDWFSRPRTELWLTTSHECRLWYSLVDERLVATVADS